MSKYSGISHKNFRLKNLLYEKKNWVATITINRPEVHNCLNLETLQELGGVLQDAAWDDRIAVVVITGAGEEAFCTGADLKEWKEDFLDRPQDFYKWMGVFIETFDRLRNIGKPTIARLNGMAVGGGNELQMSCDLAIAASDVYIRHVGTEHGSVPAAGATQWLPLIVGDRRAREILFLCEKISAQKALEWGLINEVVPRNQLDAAVEKMAANLIRKLPECTRYTKQQLNFWRDFSWAMTIGHVRDWLTVHSSAPEIVEGITAFSEKRPIDYEKIRLQLAEARKQKSDVRSRKSIGKKPAKKTLGRKK
ncbi:MAG TPA: enoyl-CoA hydratase/isomerase family protein [Bacteroidota bacterium]|nr:enoyl-CoA hydratase/isomerase family protein [Bacteroidota bacterium]